MGTGAPLAADPLEHLHRGDALGLYINVRAFLLVLWQLNQQRFGLFAQVVRFAIEQVTGDLC
jgi:hypothetical protein